LKVVANIFLSLPAGQRRIVPAVSGSRADDYALTARRRKPLRGGQRPKRLSPDAARSGVRVLIGFVSWSIQERRDAGSKCETGHLRAKIKGISAQLTSGSERRWLVSADGARIFSYEFDDSGKCY